LYESLEFAVPDRTPQKKLKSSTAPKLFRDSASGELIEIPELDQLEPGTLIDGKYKILSTIGKSEIAVVYRVEHTGKQKEFTLKLFEPEFSDSQIQRFQTEAKNIAQLDHPNTAKLIDFGVHEGKQLYYVSEFVEGETLADYLQRCGRLTYDDVFGVFLPLAWALQDAHEKGIVHRNVKPSNILLVGEQGNWSCKLLDFATGKLSEGGRNPRAQFIRASVNPQYVSPEQFTPKKTDQCSDIYSMGCTLFEAITARPPFPCTTLEEAKKLHLEGSVPSLREASLGREFPEALEDIVLTMLAKEPQKRYSSASQVAENLMRLKLSTQLRIKPKQKGKSDKDFWKMFSIIAVVLFFGLGLAIVSALQVKQTPYHRESAEFAPQALRLRSVPELDSLEERRITSPPDNSTQPFLRAVRGAGDDEFRDYIFPKTPIGTLIDPKSNSIEASGVRTMPWYGPWKFRPTPVIFETCPAAFKRFADEELRAIRFHSCGDQFKNVLEDLGRFQFLDELSFENVHFNKRDLRSIEKLQKLRSLALLSTTVSPMDLSESPLLQKVEILKIGEMPYVQHILAALTKSDKLRKLSIRNCELGKDDYLKIASIQNLESLGIQMYPAIDKELIVALAGAKHLRHLDLSDCRLSRQTINSLGNLRSLESLVLSRGSVDASQQNEIQKTLPTTRVVMF